MVEINEAAVADQVITRLLAANLIREPKIKQKRMNWERVLAQEYVREKYPYSPVWFRKEMGPYENSEQTKLYARVRRWVDAVVRIDKGILLIEFKMKPAVDAVAQISNYINLFPATPEFKRYWNEKVFGLVVCATDNDELRELCKQWNIEFDVFKPSNYEDYFKNVIQKAREQG